MNSSKKIGNFTALMLITLTFYSYSAEMPEDNNYGWLGYAKETLFNGYLGFKQLLTATTTPETGFSDLPIEVQTNLIQLFAKSCTDTTLEEAIKTIRSLAVTTKHLNKLINDPEFNLQLIKSRAKQFNVSDMKVAKELKTQASKNQLKIQLALAKIMKELIEEQENNNATTKLKRLLEGFTIEDKFYTVDFDFTYRWDQESEQYSSPLMYAVQNENKYLIQYLLENGASPTMANSDGDTPLQEAEATGNQGVIDLIQHAIEKM